MTSLSFINNFIYPFFFQESIVAPHLKHNYDKLCNLKMEEPEQTSLTSKLPEMVRFSQSSDDPQSTKVE